MERTKNFSQVKAGDVVIRELAGVVELRLKVERVDARLIHTFGGWTFRRDNGGEVDEDLGWDGLHHTGSVLIGVEPAR